ncbi:MAG: hypothetical protein KDC83_01770 [Flavobacteriales bacterium]|nr:hypothetical protein [Flavobacteriales bacterium]
MKSNISEKLFENFKWIDVEHPSMDVIKKIAGDYDIDFHLIADSMERGHLPKIEKNDRYEFIIMRAYSALADEKVANVGELSNKIAFFCYEDKLISVHRAPFEFLKIKGNFKSSKELLIHIIGEMIETFVTPSKWQSDKIDEVEKTIFLEGEQNISLEELYFQKSHTRISKKLLQITQRVLIRIQADEHSRSALQDVKDNILNLILLFDEVEEDVNNLMNTYISVTAQKSNDVMKLLTIFSAFFLPLTFIVGVYGMNFHYMPELDWRYGYGTVLSAMTVLAVLIYFWFKKRKIM